MNELIPDLLPIRFAAVALMICADKRALTMSPSPPNSRPLLVAQVSECPEHYCLNVLGGARVTTESAE